MPLNPQIEAMLGNLAAAGVPAFHSLQPEQSRGVLKQLMAALPASTAAVARVHDRTIPGSGGDIGLRVYTPEGQGPHPVLVFFHGGGWVIGDLDAYDTTCRELCGGATCVVVSVDYRLAPEHRFPAATDDALAALRWIGTHAAEIGGDPARIAVGGDSAGGNLSAVSALRARDEGGPQVCAQLLVYPVTDHYSGPSRSMIDNAEGYLLTRQDMVWFTEHYLGGKGDTKNPLFAPLHAPRLSKLPPALVITAQYDPLCDEGEAYAAALRAAGVDVQQSRYDGAIHGFFTFSTAVEIGGRAMSEACAWLRERFAVRR